MTGLSCTYKLRDAAGYWHQNKAAIQADFSQKIKSTKTYKLVSNDHSS